MAYTAWHDFTAGETLTASTMDALIANLQALFPVGTYCYMARAATTSETLVNGVWLECNAVSVLRATYPDLNTLLAGLSYPFGTVDGTHMTLPDAQGRSLVSMSSGGHTSVNGLGDSDGVAKANRAPLHNSSNSLGVSGISLTGSPGGTFVTNVGASVQPAYAGGGSNAVQSVSPTTGSPTIGTLGVSGGSLSGSVGPGGTLPIDTPAYLVAGTLFVKAVA